MTRSLAATYNASEVSNFQVQTSSLNNLNRLGPQEGLAIWQVYHLRASVALATARDRKPADCYTERHHVVFQQLGPQRH
jgi:hypothetical protein